jgi:hypothetical protein
VISLSRGQLGHLSELHRYCRALSVDGFDASDAVVVSRLDWNGIEQYAIQAGGEGRPVDGEVRAFTDEEVEAFNPEHWLHVCVSEKERHLCH